jgi:hypothetical protein
MGNVLARKQPQPIGRVEGLGFGREHVPLEKWAVKGKDPKWRPVIYM